MPNLTTSSTPLSSTLLFHPLPFRGAQSYELFRFVKLPTSLPCEERQSYGLFGTYKSLLSKTPFALKGAQRYETFRFVKPLSLFSTHFLTGRQRYEVFDIHKCRPIPSLPYPFIKDHAKSHNQTLPCHHLPHLLPLLFFRECKITNFLPCQAPSHPLPQDTAKLRTFGHSQVPPLPLYPLSKTPMLLRDGNAKVRNFHLCQAPSSDGLSSKINQGLSGSEKLQSFSLCHALS
jgi:hypothetical protein